MKPTNSQRKKTKPKRPPTSSSGNHQQLPLSFPQHLLRPTNGFLRDESPYRDSFQTALETSYLGLVVDPPSDRSLTSTLEQLQAERFFQTDVTQPFGLGTKCAKTYVTRCLVGDPGTTYKYLGLRMFAYSWFAGSLCQEIGHFKDTVLVPRTKEHLKELHQKRSYSYNVQRSRPCYNICLINRMDSSRDDYKLEPTLQQDCIAVAWHADSSLEHYSNIAVHQVIVGGGGQEWNLAVRTTPHAEGPNIRSDHTPDATVPPLSLTLPSGSAYYMLDDFNHHHQHAVLKTNQQTSAADKELPNGKTNSKKKKQKDTSSIRYSATYRLLRPSHTVQELLQQCQTAQRNFHKKGIKVWRSEQLLLNQLESEWLRQFYIQGQHHKDMLWSDWGDFVTDMWKYWGLLEGRTQFVVELLRNAAYGKCSDSSAPTSKAERKVRDKQRKAHSQIQELLTRSASEEASTSLYDPMAELLRERATLRALWKKREKDHVFTTLEAHYRPLPWPVRYGAYTTNDSNVIAESPLPEELGPLADQLVALGKAYQTGTMVDLPEMSAKERGAESKANGTAERSENSQSDAAANSKSKKNKKKKRKQDASNGTGSNANKKKKRRY